MTVDFVEIRTSIDSKEEARKIAQRLLTKHVCASVHIREASTHYYWEGKYVDDLEWEISILTKYSHINLVRNTINAEHYYVCSEFIVIPIVHTTKEFGQWIDDSITDL